jgi:hypothetical protein
VSQLLHQADDEDHQHLWWLLALCALPAALCTAVMAAYDIPVCMVLCLLAGVLRAAALQLRGTKQGKA